jgi:hypothetical protein
MTEPNFLFSTIYKRRIVALCLCHSASVILLGAGICSSISSPILIGKEIARFKQYSSLRPESDVPVLGKVSHELKGQD